MIQPLLMTDRRVKVGRRIGRLAEEGGVSVAELAEQVGMHRTQMYKVINGDLFLRYESLVKVAEIFDVSTDYLLRGSK